MMWGTFFTPIMSRFIKLNHYTCSVGGGYCLPLQLDSIKYVNDPPANKILLKNFLTGNGGNVAVDNNYNLIVFVDNYPLSTTYEVRKGCVMYMYKNTSGG